MLPSAPHATRAAAALLAAAALACADPAAPPTPTGISVAVSPSTVRVGDTVSLHAVAYDMHGRPLEGRAVVWRSETPEVAEVNGARLVGRRAGTARLVASSGDVTRPLDVPVLDRPVARILADPATLEIAEGDSARVTVTLLDDRGQPIANRRAAAVPPSGVTVSADGWITAREGGVFQVRYFADAAHQWGDQAIGTTVLLRVRERPLVAIHPVQRRVDLAVDAWTQAASIGETASGRRLALPPITMSVSDPSVLFYSGGSIRALAPGDAEIVTTLDGLEVRVPVRVRDEEPGAFDVAVRWIGTPPAHAVAAADSAVARWRRAIVGDLPDVTLALPADACADGAPALDERIDDLLLWIEIAAIDGPGGILGQAGPCIVRRDGLPLAGTVTLDLDDIGSTSDGSIRLTRLLMHEIGHVLGIGTLWDEGGHIAGADTDDPRFTGPGARTAAGDIGYTEEEAIGIAIETDGGDGTAGAHWRESLYRSELMTGWLEMFVGAPIGRFTLGALADLGYEVRWSGAEYLTVTLPPMYAILPPPFSPFAPPPPPVGRREAGPDGAAGTPLRDDVRRPRFEVGPDGVARPVRR